MKRFTAAMIAGKGQNSASKTTRIIVPPCLMCASFVTKVLRTETCLNTTKFTMQTKENLDVMIVANVSMSIQTSKFTSEFTQEKKTFTAMIVERVFWVPVI